MRKRIYIETSVPSFYYTLRTDPESIVRMNWTREWWRLYAGVFELLSSPAVIAELRRGTGARTVDRIALLNDVRFLPSTTSLGCPCRC
jgi:hypothetical protein